jgi:hypothetical protein
MRPSSTGLRLRLLRLAAVLSVLPGTRAAAEACPEGPDNDWIAGYGAAVPMPGNQAAALVRRDASSITLQTDRGPLVIRDSAGCALDEMHDDYPDRVRNAFLDAFQAPAGYRMRRDDYEGNSWVWVERATGIEVPMGNLPRFPPDGRWAVAVGAADAYNFDGIEVWNLEWTFRKVWMHSPTMAETHRSFVFLGWDDATTVRLCAWRIGTTEPPDPFLLRHGPLGWALAPAPAR